MSKSVLLDNGCPLNHNNLIMHRTKNSLSKPKTPRAKDNGNLANISVPYYLALSKSLRQISDRHNISLTFTSNRNLRNMLTKTKTPPHTTRNVIYQIPCKDCNATYCGQTRRPLHLRLSEHQRFTNNSKSFTSTDLPTIKNSFRPRLAYPP